MLWYVKKGLKFLFLNLTKIIISIITSIILIFTFKKLYSLLNKYPRIRFINGYLDIASKFDKSTGLDIEMANILSKSLTDYIKKPDDIMNNLSNDKNIEYIKQHLFKNFNYQSPFFKILRKFIKYRNDIFESGFDVLSNPNDEDSVKIPKRFLDVYFSKNTNIPASLNVGSDGLEIPETNTLGDGFLSIFFGESPVSFNINNKILNDISVLSFIQLLKDKPDNEPDVLNNTHKEIHEIFSNILKTSNDSKDNDAFLKNIFYRNVLYVLTLEYENDIVNTDGNGQLQLLERNNPISYIYPDIKYKIDEPIYELYGKYLHIPNSVKTKSIKTFKKLFSDVKIDSNIQSILNNASKNYNDKYNMGPNTLSGLNDMLRNDIDIYIDNFEKEKILENQYNLIFKKLNDYFTYDIDIKTKNSNWNDIFFKYKLELSNNRGKNYNSGNNKLNELYEFNNEDNSEDNNKVHNIDDKYNINKVDNKTKTILEIFNVLIIFDDFKEKYKRFDDNILYEKLLEYLWTFEYFTTLTYYNNIDLKYEFLLSSDEKKNFLNDYHKALKLSLYFRDKDIINITCYLNIIYRIKNPEDNQLNIVRNNLFDLSSYYLSFMEIKLFANFINDVKEYKEDRTGFDIQNDYWFPKVSYLWKNIIKKEIIDVDFTKKNIYRIQKILYTSIRDFLGDMCNFLFTDEVRDFWDCGDFTLFEEFKEKYKKNNVKNNVKNKDNTEFQGIIEKFFGGGLGNVLKPLKGILKSVVNFFLDRLSDFPIIKEALKIVIFIVKLIESISTLGLVGVLLSLIGLLLYIGAIIIKYPIFTTAEFGIATLILGLLVIPFVLILILIKSSIILLIIALISIICIIIIVLDNTIEKMMNTKIKLNNKDPTRNINIVSKFIYKQFLSCENSPHSWYKNSRFDLENKSTRGFFCNKPCASNYRLSEDNSFCEKAPTSVPYYCPQPLLFRYFRKETVYGKNFIQEFSPESHPILLLKNNSIQKDYINNFNKDKKEYYNSCQNINKDNFENYNIIGKNICAYGYSKYNYKDEEYNENIKNKIKQICKQTYCENGNYESFCYKYDDDIFKPEDIIKDNNKFTKYLKTLILGIILYSICIYIVNSFNYIIKNKKISNPFGYKYNKNIDNINKRFLKFKESLVNNLNNKSKN